MNHSLDALRSTHPIFLVKEPSWNWSGSTLQITATYSAGTSEYRHTLEFFDVGSSHTAKNDSIVQYLARLLSLVELFNYWKASASPNISVEWPMSDTERRWWRHLLEHGMGEYFYKNSIDFTKPDFVNFTSPDDSNFAVPQIQVDHEMGGVLIPVGGGKDSAVSLDIIGNALTAQKRRVAAFVMNPTPAALATIAVSQVDEVIQVSRHIDKLLIQQNSDGYLNGHIPFSAVLAVVSFVAAVFHNFSKIALSNERSSNEGNVEYLGRTINHQYSKTYAFETSFRDFGAVMHASTPDYFSFLRPLYELQIAAIFANKKKYHAHFVSCNRTKPTQPWCGTCPKCLFTYSILLPFIGEGEAVLLFGKNVLEDTELYSLALELIGKSTSKPFECVGTHEESIAAFILCIEWYRKNGKSLPMLLHEIDQKVFNESMPSTATPDKILQSWNAQHHLPDEFAQLLQHEFLQRASSQIA